MALDAQSNWNVEMSQPLKLASTKKQLNIDHPSNPSNGFDTPSLGFPRDGFRKILLPSEIITHILEYVKRQPSPQSTIWACSLVSRAWYSSTIATLYERPFISGSGFDAFVHTICPSKNAHIRHSSLSILVKSLDMSYLVHNSSKSLTARLLGRLKGNLEEFIAPQASFGINSFAALSKCAKLKVLNLSLISASISNKLLFQTLKSLQELETLFFPRSSGHSQEDVIELYVWPQRLKALHLAGGINDHFITMQLSGIPQCLERLSIQHCTQVRCGSLVQAFEHIGVGLKHLTIRYPMPRLAIGDFDTLLQLCANLLALRISAEYISNNLFTNILSHPLRILDVESTPSYLADPEYTPTVQSLYEVVELDRLKDLRSVRVTARLGWQATTLQKEITNDLIEAMEDNDMENQLGLWVGVWQGD
ncbi:hypothetical protein BJ875DRAFT_267801 [Amylocarpus encephaloides]|uniref:F-box domain-containing protein n=1 Tax=Amylocarpus encephaloides TaxID=45428 RepID=A0A9P7YL52_9HELO|nr:hypothetical protein BJ875DRAFT_267801 [Amylocarpus encephaloides]